MFLPGSTTTTGLYSSLQIFELHQFEQTKNVEGEDTLARPRNPPMRTSKTSPSITSHFSILFLPFSLPFITLRRKEKKVDFFTCIWSNKVSNNNKD